MMISSTRANPDSPVPTKAVAGVRILIRRKEFWLPWSLFRSFWQPVSILRTSTILCCLPISLLRLTGVVYVSGAYANELEQKQIDHNIILGKSNSKSAYRPVGHGDDSKPLTGDHMSYPYADGHNAYGNTAQHAHHGSYAWWSFQMLRDEWIWG